MYWTTPIFERAAASIRVGLPIILAISFGAGCGKPSLERATVRGLVTYRGQNVQSGSIVFSPVGETKGPPAGADIAEGSYSIAAIEGPIVGHHRVEIHGFRKTGNKIPDLLGDVSDSNRPMIDELVPLLPAKFNLQSTLTAEIKPDDNVVDFEL